MNNRESDHLDDDGICPGCGGADGCCDCFDDEDPYAAFDCHMDKQGYCGKAGSEECDWECPYGRNIKN